ncbi:hypothetical protein LINGRAHAP2_LOCUS28973 [Linum grandiflorum]
MHLTNPHLNSFSFTYSAFLQPLKARSHLLQIVASLCSLLNSPHIVPRSLYQQLKVIVSRYVL